MPVTQLAADLGELRSNLAQIKKAENSQIPNNSQDNIGKFCE